MPENQKVVDQKISQEWQKFLNRSFSANGIQFGLAAYLSEFGEHAEIGWDKIFKTFRQTILTYAVNTQEEFTNLSEDLQQTLIDAGVMKDEKQMLSRELDKFENKFKPSVVSMAKKLHKFREERTLDMIKKLLGDDDEP